jgi:hypothetical protein
MAQIGFCTKLMVKPICPLSLFSHEQGDKARQGWNVHVFVWVFVNVCKGFHECAQEFYKVRKVIAQEN